MSSKVKFLYLNQVNVIEAGGLDIHGTLAAVETSFHIPRFSGWGAGVQMRIQAWP